MTKQPWLNKATVQAALVTTIPAFIVAVVAIFFSWRNSDNQIKQNEQFFFNQLHRDSILNVKQTQLTLRQLELNKQELELVQKQTHLDSTNLLFSKNQNDFLNSQISIAKSNNWFDFVQLVSLIGEHLDKYYKNDSTDFSQINTKTQDYYLSKLKKQSDYASTLIKIMKSGLRNPLITGDKEIWDLWKNILNSSNGITSTIDFDKKYKIEMNYINTYDWNEKTLDQIYHEYFLLQVLIQDRKKLHTNLIYWA